MVQNSQNTEVYELESQIRNQYGRLVFTYVTHNKMADILIKRADSLELALIITSSLTLAGILLPFVNAFYPEINFWFSIASACLSIIVVTLTIIIKTANHKERSYKHKNTANALWKLREEYLSLLADMKYIHVDDVRRKRDLLIQKTEEVYSCAPQTSAKAYKMAQKAINEEEEQFLSDEEIDNMLPVDLRRGN